MAKQAAAQISIPKRDNASAREFLDEFCRPPAGLPKCLQGAGVSGSVLVPAALAGAYVAIAEGDCMAPSVIDGDRLVFHPRVRVERGMIVGITFHDGRQPITKRLASELPEPANLPIGMIRTIMLEMDSPRTQLFVAWPSIERVHALVGVVRDGAYLPIIADPFGKGGAPC